MTMSSSGEQPCILMLQNCRTLKHLRQIQALVCKAGLESDAYIAGKLILKCAVLIPNALNHARRLLLHMSNPDVFMYNTVARGLSESETPETSIVTFNEMRRKLSTPDSFSFAFVLKGAANMRSLHTGMQLHCQTLINGLNTHLFVGTTLTSMYGECGCMDYAMKVFEDMTEPNIVGWNALLTACFRCDDLKNAEEIFNNKMPFWDLTSWNVMLAGYAKSGELGLARELFLRMPVKDDVSWSSMIAGFAKNGHFEEAFKFIRELKQVGTKINEVSLTAVLSACAQAGAFGFGTILHGFLEKAGFVWNISVNNALLDTYVKSGNINMARSIFRCMSQERNIISWTILIAGLGMHGFGEEAIEVFDEMEESGARPDGITFIAVLYACSHAGLILQGCKYFQKMINVHGIEPSMEHYGCMVDLYGRAGLLQKAYDFINQMPILPSSVIWRTLLGGCSTHGNVELAEKVKLRLHELDPHDAGDHVLLSNIYAISGKWKDTASIRRSMKDRMIKKSPGWSIIEVDKNLYTFLASQERNDATELCYKKLEEIMLTLKVEGGYVPETTKTVLYDIEEEEKEYAVIRHSEKLAVAFGMIKLSKSKTLKIVKNLRICSDCHTVMKLISKVYRLEIVVRDRSRFHSFTDGSCSCRDYW